MAFAYGSHNGCDFMTVLIDFLCQLDYLEDVITGDRRKHMCFSLDLNRQARTNS